MSLFEFYPGGNCNPWFVLTHELWGCFKYFPFLNFFLHFAWEINDIVSKTIRLNYSEEEHFLHGENKYLSESLWKLFKVVWHVQSQPKAWFDQNFSTLRYDEKMKKNPPYERCQEQLFWIIIMPKYYLQIVQKVIVQWIIKYPIFFFISNIFIDFSESIWIFSIFCWRL